MKKIFTVLLTLTLYGCAYLNSRNENNPLSRQEQVCSELKRNIIFDTTGVTGIGTASSTEYAEMTRLYNKNGCDKLEK